MAHYTVMRVDPFKARSFNVLTGETREATVEGYSVHLYTKLDSQDAINNATELVPGKLWVLAVPILALEQKAAVSAVEN